MCFCYFSLTIINLWNISRNRHGNFRSNWSPWLLRYNYKLTKIPHNFFAYSLNIVNGGQMQPGCDIWSNLFGGFNVLSKFISNLINNRGCSHTRAIDMYSQCLKSPLGTVAYECDSYKSFQNVIISSVIILLKIWNKKILSLLKGCLHFVWCWQFPMRPIWDAVRQGLGSIALSCLFILQHLLFCALFPYIIIQY